MLTKIVNGVTVVLTAEEEAAVLAQWAAENANGQKRIPEVKAEAQRRILALHPAWTRENFVVKELNVLMQVSALLDKKTAGTALTASEETFLSDARTLKTKIDAIRSASDQIEADLLASTDPSNFNVVTNAKWPV